MKIFKNGTQTKVLIDSALRDETWLVEGGQALAALRDPSTREVILDFSNTSWADPTPLLGLACAVSEFAARGGGLVLDLGKTRQGNGNRFLIFFARHGFLSLFARYSRTIWNDHNYDVGQDSHIEGELRNLPGLLAYQDSECIPATIFAVSDLRQPHLSSTVELTLANARLRISSWLSGNARRRGLLLHRLRVILNEALDNVGEHAYQQGGFGAIFARIRTGLPDELSSAVDWERAKRDENRYCPTLSRCNSGKRPGWLELFVCDIGKGIK